MNKSILVGAVLGVAVATAGGVVAGYKMLKDEDPAAERVETVAATPTPLAEECQPGNEAPRDPNRIAGTAIGALVGGAVGRDVGDRDVTTAAGAAAGAFAGNQIQKKFQENRAGNDGC